MKNKKQTYADEEEPVPVFKSWNWWYALVLGLLACLILAFYLITVTFE